MVKELYDKSKAILSQVNFENTKAKQIVATTDGGLIVTLHNKDLRPTRYHVTPNINGMFVTYTFDTLIRENDSHVCLKKSFGSNTEGLVELLQEMLSQDAEGTTEETMSNYTPLGLLFWKNK